MKLKAFLQTMTLEERKAFAKRCGSSAGHLNNISYGYRPCAEALAISIEKESGRRVTCEEIRPDVDWAYLRNTPPRKSLNSAA
jgi:DNA-binding transcriptional regulator YdaS (Cro superfamily)